MRVIIQRNELNNRPLKVFSYDELVRQAKTADGWKRFALGAGAGLRAAAASTPAQTNQSGQFNAYNSYGTQYNGYYFGQSTTVDPAQQAVAQSMINSDTRAQASSLNNELGNRMAALGSALRTTTTYPDKSSEASLR